MKLRPLRTLPLRVRLRATVERDTLLRKRARSVSNPQSGRVQGILRSNIHPYPGLGHQVSAAASAILWARDLAVDVHIDRLKADHDGLFNFGQLTPSSGPVFRLPPVRDERDPASIEFLRDVMLKKSRRVGAQSTFILALDQFRWDLTPASSDLRRALLLGSHAHRLKELEKLDYIAVHVRRGDITIDSRARGSSVSRWLDLGWYEAVLSRLNEATAGRYPLRIYAADAEEEVLDIGRSWQNDVKVVREGSAESDFLEMVAARVLVGSPSSFSHTAALCSTGTILAPYPWWHHIPDGGRWVRVNQYGDFIADSTEYLRNDNWS